VKALIVQSPGIAEIVDVPVPEPGPGEVRARVRYCGVCATDIAIFTGNSSFVDNGWVQYPVRIGHEWSGVIEKIGEGVEGLKPGDNIVAQNGVPCFTCEQCKKGRIDRCPSGRAVGTVGDVWEGAFAEYMIMPAQLVFKLDPKISLKEAALIEPACIAMNGIVQSRYDSDDSILVIGTGPIGLAAVALLKALGCKNVMMSGRRESKLAFAKKMGADYVINTSTQDINKVVMERTGDVGVDIVIETSGNLEAFKECFSYVAVGGQVMQVGFYEKLLNDFDVDCIALRGIQLFGIAGMPAEVVKSVIDLMESGKVSFEPLITSVYPFSEVDNAIQKVIENDENRIKVLVEM